MNKKTYKTNPVIAKYRNLEAKAIKDIRKLIRDMLKAERKETL